MAGIYVASAQITGVTTAKTLMYLSAPGTAVVELLEVHVTNFDNDTNEQSNFSITRISTLGTPTATTTTIEPLAGYGAATATVKHNVTASEPTYGDDFARRGVPTLTGFHWVPTSEGARIFLAPTDDVGVRHLSTIASTGLEVEIVFREYD